MRAEFLQGEMKYLLCSYFDVSDEGVSYVSYVSIC